MAVTDRALFPWRMWAVTAAMLVGVGVLLATLWRTQVVKGHDYNEVLHSQSYNRVRLPGTRGRIVDRNGVVLVDNRPSYNISFFLEDLGVKPRGANLIPVVRENVGVLRDRMGLDVKIQDTALRTHFARRRPLPLTVWQDLTPSTLAAFSERGPWNKGIALIVEPVRQYTFGSMAAHILGHVGKPENSDQQDISDFNYYQVDLVGKSGIEKDYDAELRGEAGILMQQLDARRNKIGEFVSRPAKPGNNVVLSIDSEIQQILERAFSADPSQKGTAMVIDPNGGDVLGMVSWPEFDPNWFVPSITKEHWRALQSASEKPLINRAIQSLYSPGSTFKVPVAMQALQQGIITPGTIFNCPGFFNLGNITFHCYHGMSHGNMDVRHAIQNSCNVFFYNVGNRFGPQKLGQAMMAMGYGSKTGIELENENAGLVPTDEWQSQVTKGKQTKMSHGEAVNMAIGQGALNVTPLQMAMMAAAVANRGTLYVPRLVTKIVDKDGKTLREVPPKVKLELPVNKEYIDIVREGMLLVVKEGTGVKAQVPGVNIAGKTGSAQFKGFDHETGMVSVKTRAWFISFAPFEAPRYAVAVLIEGGVTGGSTAAPIAKKIYEDLFALEKRRAAGKASEAIPAKSVSPSELPGDIGGENVIEAQPLSPEELDRIESMQEGDDSGPPPPQQQPDRDRDRDVPPPPESTD
ncbi:MAG: penicillin-binding protein 2 [Verrucomicrobiae bacterium]|nr:penicillin-binding protein 2 [Verrucomicrobiae bacterium]